MPLMRLVFLHGVGGGHAAWDDQVAYFSVRGYRCTAWDQPGYGGTPAPNPYTLEAVTEALRKEIGTEPAVLVGHSMGGFVAQETYARFPQLVRALVLCFTSPSFGGDPRFARQFIADRLGLLEKGKNMVDLAQELMPSMRGRRSDPRGLAKAQRITSSVSEATYRKAVQLLTTFDRRDNLAKIAVPTLLVAGSDDRVAPPKVMQSMAQGIRQSEIVVLDGCGHLGPMDQPDLFNATLEPFLKKI